MTQSFTMPSSAPASGTPDNLVFEAYHQPTLQSGNYAIQVAHTLQTQNVAANDPGYIASKSFTASRNFRVEGERFYLKPADIQAVFPPKGSLGDHSNVLPHIVLSHSTLPWERSPDGTTNPFPWLLLLVFSEQEKPEPKVIKLSELATQGAKFPTISLSPHQKTTDSVTVIDVPRQTLEPLLPSRDELTYLAHVRRLQFPQGSQLSRTDLDRNEQAVIIANRLPQPGATTTVHLVSIEGRYTNQGVFDFQGAGNQDLIRLVSLTSWRFACVTSQQTFANMIKGLERDHRSFQLPTSTNNDANLFLNGGFVPVRHALRQGSKTLSWYRGPFATGAVTDTVTVPVHTSDALLRYHTSVGMFDVSYASAWELGRLMALQSPTFSADLYAWKRQRDQQDKLTQRSEQSDHPLVVAPTRTTLPASVRTWLEQLSQLQGVPFKYLVPDEKLLPRESIRFFQMDSNWIRCLVDGAYSIGRITAADFDRDRTTTLPVSYTNTTGVLIRSDLVSGYPGLLIDGYDAQNQAIHKLQQQQLSPNILLCLFRGSLNRLDIHQKPEMLHFALELPSDRTYRKTLRTVQNVSPNPQTIQGTLSTTRTVPIATLATAVRNALNISNNQFNSGTLALQMLETSEKVSFYRGESFNSKSQKWGVGLGAS